MAVRSLRLHLRRLTLADADVCLTSQTDGGFTTGDNGNFDIPFYEILYWIFGQHIIVDLK